MMAMRSVLLSVFHTPFMPPRSGGTGVRRQRQPLGLRMQEQPGSTTTEDEDFDIGNNRLDQSTPHLHSTPCNCIMA